VESGKSFSSDPDLWLCEKPHMQVACLTYILGRRPAPEELIFRCWQQILLRPASAVPHEKIGQVAFRWTRVFNECEGDRLFITSLGIGEVT